MPVLHLPDFFQLIEHWLIILYESLPENVSFEEAKYRPEQSENTVLVKQSQPASAWMVCEFRAIVRLPFRRGKYTISIKTVTKKSPQPTIAARRLPEKHTLPRLVNLHMPCHIPDTSP